MACGLVDVMVARSLGGAGGDGRAAPEAATVEEAPHGLGRGMREARLLLRQSLTPQSLGGAATRGAARGNGGHGGGGSSSGSSSNSSDYGTEWRYFLRGPIWDSASWAAG